MPQHDLEARRDKAGSYVVGKPRRIREPVDWFMATWVGIGAISIAMPFTGAARWLIGW